MKTVAFMAALLIGSAAVAQTTPTAPDGTMQPGTPMAPTPPADGTTPPPAPATPTDGMTPPAPGAPMAGQPMAQPMPGQPMGAQGNVQFAPPMATPAPAPKDSYPVCSRTVRDSCRNPGGK